MDGRSGDAVLFILKGYPRLSETFIAQEIRALEQRGLGSLRSSSLRQPTDSAVHPIHRGDPRAGRLSAGVSLSGAAAGAARPGGGRGGCRAMASARRAWLQDLRRDPTPNRGRRFGQALVLAAELPAEVGRLHAHFLHTPASVARYAALLTGLPWSCSAHAKDIWTTPDWEKREKLADAAWAVTCTAAGRDHLAGAGARRPERGPGLSRPRSRAASAAATAAGPPQRDGSDAADPVDHPLRRPRGGEEGLWRSADGAGRAAAGSWPGGSSISAAARCCRS